jgi:hypothetical protein
MLKLIKDENKKNQKKDEFIAANINKNLWM